MKFARCVDVIIEKCYVFFSNFGETLRTLVETLRTLVFAFDLYSSMDFQDRCIVKRWLLDNILHVIVSLTLRQYFCGGGCIIVVV